jgi:DNA-binding NtrC family response regulator
VIAASSPNVVVSDIRMEASRDGLVLLDRLRRERPSTPVVLITAFGSIDTAIHAVREGAFDYISKPFDIAALVATVKRALATVAHPDPAMPADVEQAAAVGRQLIGRSPAMLEVYKLVARVANANAALLITGESGTGKELVARAVHRHSARHADPFVAVNCGALTETLLESELFGHVKGAFTGAIGHRRGLFEQAGGGTIFLDEAGETSAALQVKLLRVLQEREVVPVGGSTPVAVRARVIAASGVDLEELARSGNFRRDLLYRLNVINIHLPPLRERREDIPWLVAHFIDKYATPGQRPKRLSDHASALVQAYDWPGNVRELENAVERAMTLSRGDLLTEDDFPPEVRLQRGPGGAADPFVDPASFFAGLPALDDMERRYIVHVLRASAGNRKRAAEVLGINRRTLYRMAARLGIDLGEAN